MTIEKAREEQTESIHQLVSRTIREIYSRYYHEEAVRFFLAYHMNMKSKDTKWENYVIFQISTFQV